MALENACYTISMASLCVSPNHPESSTTRDNSSLLMWQTCPILLYINVLFGLMGQPASRPLQEFVNPMHAVVVTSASETVSTESWCIGIVCP